MTRNQKIYLLGALLLEKVRDWVFDAHVKSLVNILAVIKFSI
jgi:hypothetical protein